MPTLNFSCSYALKQLEFKLSKQNIGERKEETLAKKQLQTQQQQTERFKVMQQQQEQSRAMMALLKKLTNKSSLDLCQQSGFTAYSAAPGTAQGVGLGEL